MDEVDVFYGDEGASFMVDGIIDKSGSVEITDPDFYEWMVFDPIEDKVVIPSCKHIPDNIYPGNDDFGWCEKGIYTHLRDKNKWIQHN